MQLGRRAVESIRSAPARLRRPHVGDVRNAEVGIDAVNVRPLRIAMIGTRGVPARYSGVETVVEALGAALVERGHEVTVYCRRDGSARPAEHRGMRLRYVPTVPGGGIAAFVHAFVATLDAIPRRYDVIHYHAVGPGLQAVHRSCRHSCRGVDDRART